MGTGDTFAKRLKSEGEIVLHVRARTNATNTAFNEVLEDESLKIDLAAVPEDGKANAELVKL